MHAQIQEVKRGERVSAELFNALVRRVNERTTAPEQNLAPIAKGEFWIKNESSATLPALSFARLNGFLSTFADANAAKSAVASGAVVFSATSPSGAGVCLAQALEGIEPGKVGRACLPYGPLVFSFPRENESVQRGDRVAFATGTAQTFGQMFASDSGEFVVVARESTSRLIAVCAIAACTRYEAGDGISITGSSATTKQISAQATLKWGCWNGSSYPDAATMNVVPNCKIRFGPAFQARSSRDDTAGYEVGLKTTQKQIVTGATPTFSPVEVLVPAYNTGAAYDDPVTGNWAGACKRHTIQVCTGVTLTTETVDVPGA